MRCRHPFRCAILTGMARTRNVLIAAPISRVARMDKMSGIFRYLSSSTADWSIRISDIDKLDLSDIDGMIVTGRPSAAIIRKIEKSNLPTVTIAIPCKARRNLVRLESDAEAIANAVCEEFLACWHYKSLVFATGKLRTAFAGRCEPALRSCARTRGLDFTHITTNLAAIAKLPRPTAVFALNDTIAWDIIRESQSRGIKIPNDLSVIGFCNDRVLCENTKPSISSADIDFEQQGFKAAKTLDALMTKPGTIQEGIIFNGLRTIVHRGSTPKKRTGDWLVRHARDFIRKNAVKGITVQDVVREMRVSRRLLELRFRESSNRSIRETIIDRRMEATKNELLASDDPITTVCERCGWRSVNHPKQAFKRQFGQSMSVFRKRHVTASHCPTCPRS